MRMIILNYVLSKYYKIEVLVHPSYVKTYYTNVTKFVLILNSLGINESLHFDFMDTLPACAFIWELELLFALGGLNKITTLGRKIVLEEKQKELDNREGYLEKKWKRLKFGKSETWSWYLWEGENKRSWI